MARSCAHSPVSPFAVVNFDLLKSAAAVSCLVGLACVIEPVSANSEAEWRANFEREPRFAAEQTSLGVLAGFRGLAADLAWLRGYMAWEQRDVAKTQTSIELAAALDGRPLCFWINGARIIACDMPAWEKEALDPTAVHDPNLLRSIEEKYAGRALAHLEKAMRRHPRNAALWIERANIEYGRLHDAAAAARSYRLAAESPHAPYYAARLHAEMLHRAGRSSEALLWLKELYPRLPKHIEAACSDVVLGRIHALEDELSVPMENRFIASGEPGSHPIGL